MTAGTMARTKTFHRRGTVFVTGERVWIGALGEPDSLGVRRVIDARGVVWERRGGWWRRYDRDDRSHFTWRPLVAHFGPLTEVVMVGQGIDETDGEP